MKPPEHIFGRNTEESYKKYLEESKKQPEVQEAERAITHVEGVNLADYIVLPQHNLYIAKEKILHNNNWYQAHEELHKQGARMLTIKEFVDFLELLSKGDVKDGLGRRLSVPEVGKLYGEIAEQRDPWRSEWLDAYFRTVNNGLQIEYNHKIINGKLVPQNTELLEDCLMETSWVDLKSANRQGLPTRKTDKHEFYFYNPLSDRVARFIAYSDRTDLNCNRYPQYSYAVLGVRPACDF